MYSSIHSLGQENGRHIIFPLIDWILFGKAHRKIFIRSNRREVKGIVSWQKKGCEICTSKGPMTYQRGNTLKGTPFLHPLNSDGESQCMGRQCSGQKV